MSSMDFLDLPTAMPPLYMPPLKAPAPSWGISRPDPINTPYQTQ